MKFHCSVMQAPLVLSTTAYTWLVHADVFRPSATTLTVSKVYAQRRLLQAEWASSVSAVIVLPWAASTYTGLSLLIPDSIDIVTAQTRILTRLVAIGRYAI